MRNEKELLLDILEAIEKIEKHSARGDQVFYQDEMVQVWIIYYIQVIGEAASKLPLSLRRRHPKIPWLDIVDMRNVLVHRYFGIDLKEIWNTVNVDIPELKDNIIKILDEFK